MLHGIHPKHFRVNSIKISNGRDKRNFSNIAADTVALPSQQSLLIDLSRKIEGDAGYCGTYGKKQQINLVSLWDSFTNVG